MSVSTFFVELREIIAIFISYNIVSGLFLVLICLLVTFCICNLIAVKFHYKINFH